MSESGLTAELAKVVDRLRGERQDYLDRIAQIELVFAQYGITPGSTDGRRRGGRPKGSVGRPKGSVGRPKGSVGRPKGSGKRGRRKRGSFAVTGEQMVISFVKSHGKPKTSDINAEWKKQGRGGTADNTLTKLVSDKQLKRMKLKGERGSRYAAA